MGVVIDREPGPPDPHTGASEGCESLVARRDGRDLARVCLWWEGTPPLAGERVGAIGGLAPSAGPLQDAEGAGAAVALLAEACRRLERKGCTRVLAPMDGNTWGAYRGRLDPPVGFTGEPDPGPPWIAALLRCGFQEEARYLSSRCDDLLRRRVTPRLQRRFAGLRLGDGQGLDPQPLLPRLHRLVQRGFQGQPYFLPLPFDGFARRFQDQVRPDPARLALLAFDGEDLVGLLLAHRAAELLVVRTLVVQPGRAQAGLGALLLEQAHRRAHDGGCRAAIHALMHTAGSSLPLSRHYARPLCRYVLMGRRLGRQAGG